MNHQIQVTSYIIFLITLTIVFINLISIVFPAFIVTNITPYPTNLNQFEIGPLTIPLISVNAVLIAVGLAYYKKKLPSTIQKPIEFFLNFEISRKTTLIVGIILLVIYTGFSVSELAINEEEQWPDYLVLKKGLEIWPSGESDDIYVQEQNSRYVRMFLLDVSQKIFQNIKVLPFVASILIVITTFFLTYQISKKRFAGIVSMIILLQSYTFLQFDTIAVYENFWVLFYLLSILLIQKKWYLSSTLYTISIFTKAFVAPFVLMTLFYTLNTRINKRKKIVISLSYGVAIIFILAVLFTTDSIYPNIVSINFSDFLLGFASWSNQMRSDILIVMASLPLTLGLFLTAKRGIHEANSMLVFILGTILMGSLLALLTDFYFILPYRYIPFIVFFSISVGVFLSKNRQSTNLSKVQ